MICYDCEKEKPTFSLRRCQRCYGIQSWKFSERKKRGSNKFGSLRAYLSWLDKMPTSTEPEEQPQKVILFKNKKRAGASKKQKPKTELQKAATALRKVLHEFIRLDAADKFGNCKCFTCGKILPYKGTGRMHAGHFITSGQHPMTRYDLDNIRPQCLQCNYYGSGKQQLFRELLVLELGIERVTNLEIRSKLHKKWSVFELKVLTRHYSIEFNKIKNKLQNA